MKKIILWQFFTKDSIWLRKHILDFILSNDRKVIFDPFAGDWHILELWKTIWFSNVLWMDIDESKQWQINDSLVYIPNIQNSIIITNPPYLTNYSAKRKGVYKNVSKYFENTLYDDLYKIALEKCIQNNDLVIAIVPETFINSSFSKSKLYSITILEDNPFDDTENPVCVLCFDGKDKNYDNISVYKNDLIIWGLWDYEKMRLNPINSINIRFNKLSGQIALRAVDMPNPSKRIQFMRKDQLEYDLKWIKDSSRLITIISIDDKTIDIDKYVNNCNLYLNEFRLQCNDILLSPFKWNDKNWNRRRRLDYKTARAIMEKGYNSMHENSLFSI